MRMGNGPEKRVGVCFKVKDCRGYFYVANTNYTYSYTCRSRPTRLFSCSVFSAVKCAMTCRLNRCNKLNLPAKALY